ncbi:MAG: hypothetical protein QOG71_3474 [Pyrinomonadaceae bacterium]|nr:hypothetical protein [Pyrinomonadaceae bacterium]
MTAAIVALIIGLSLILIFLLWVVLPRQAGLTADAQRPPVRAKRDLPAFHLLTTADVDVRNRPDGKDTPAGEKPEDFENQLLAEEVKEREALTVDMLVKPEWKAILDNAIQVGLPANTSTTLGGTLKVGDVVELVWFPGTKSGGQMATDPAQIKPEYVKNLVVVSVPAGKVPDAPSPPAAAAAPTAAATPKNEKPGEATSTTEAATPAEKKTTPPPSAVLVLALDQAQIANFVAATESGSKWILTRRSNVSIHK